MNAKFVLALILTLQVSMSLCEVPTPSQELVDKYDDMRAKFYSRLLIAFGKLQAAAAPMLEQVGGSERRQAAKERVEDLQTKPAFQAAVKVATAVGEEVAPVVVKARTSVLGVYEHYLRPHIGASLSSAIDNIKVYLDEIMPTE